MNAANPELCQELHELSGWYTPLTWFTGYFEDQIAMRDSPPLQTTLQGDPPEREICPAFDLGYLLRKLEERRYQLRIEHNHSDMKWYAYYAGKSQRSLFDEEGDWGTEADTPENAACLLAIELFKQGILTREVAA